MTLGADQSQRNVPALASDYVLADETSLQALLEMTRRLAHALRFVGEDGRPAGSWGRLLDRDESALLAVGLSLDLQRHEQTFLNEFGAARLEGLARCLIELATWVDTWFDDLAWIERPWARALRERLEEMTTQAYSRDIPATNALGLHGVLRELIRRARRVLAEDKADEPPPAAGEIRRFYFALLQTIGRAQAMAEEDWQASLNSGLHEPAAGLLLAFLQAFRTVQNRINTFTARLTSFYYDDVLRFGLRPAHPERVHLLFERDPSYPSPAVVPAGTRFLVTTAPQGETVAYTADHDLVVTGVSVATLRTLRMQRDPLISPEFEFGYVTRAKIDAFPPNVGFDPDVRAQFVPLLGPDLRGSPRKEKSARIGVAVSSPVLWLKDGERAVELCLVLSFPDGDITTLLDRLTAATDDLDLRTTLGRLFARWILTDRDPFTDDQLSLIRDTAGSLLRRRRGVATDDTAASDFLYQLLGPDELGSWSERRRLVRDALTENMFSIALSAEGGWFQVQRAALLHDPRPGAAEGALTFRFHLSNEDPPIIAPTPEVHGEEWPTEAPVIRLTLEERAPVFPLSLMQDAMLDAVDIAVEVEGLRDVKPYNQLGPLDASRPFMPFGPLPVLDSYLVIGAEELARKRINRLVVRPEWIGLPPAGFERYYEGYEAELDDDAFAVAPAILRDGLWAPGAARPQKLFEQTYGAPRALPIHFDPAALRAQWRPTDEPLDLDQNSHNGFVRLSIAAPAEAFGHQLYPTVLTDTLSMKARGKKRITPNLPYTPLLARITLDYSASARIEVGKAPDGGDDAHRILHLHPFGVEAAHPTDVFGHQPLLPVMRHDGHLYLGLQGGPPQDLLTLFFDLRQEAAVEDEARRTPRPRIEWAWLSAAGWQRLDDRRVLSDTTAGFLRSGVIALDLPPGLVDDNPAMPQGFFWIRMSSDDPSSRFAGLRAVTAQALRATRTPESTPSTTPLKPGSIDLRSAAVPGVAVIRQPETGFGLRPAETLRQQRTRIGERLRHKNRASSGWDYERLVLEHFNTVQRVRCISNLDSNTGKTAPGHVLIVVTPASHRNNPLFAARPMRLDPLELDRIEQHLAVRASPAAKITVRSPSFELVQVRCRVAIRPGTDAGESLRRINTAIVNQLSPWRDDGCCSTFDWQVRGEDIEDAVRRIPGVETVTGISMVHVWEGLPDPRGATWHFEDTAARPVLPGAEQAVSIRSQHPWTLALPVEEHFIDVVFDDAGDDPMPTGVAQGADRIVASNTRAAARSLASIAGMQIGATFVVGPLPSERADAESDVL